MATSINPQEIEHFARDSARWWDEDGPFRPLHRLNPVRLQYIRDQAARHFGLEDSSLTPLKGLRVLDIGCGGGLVCEPMARMGAEVLGIDADNNAIEIARDHAERAGLAVTYKATSAESLIQEKGRFDIVLALEIIEHVNNGDEFVRNCVNLCKPGGIIIFSTLNRTPQSLALGIVAAEYLLRWVPRGTHQWKKFVRPSELARMVRLAGARERDITGLRFNPVAGEFFLSARDLSVNYFMTAVRT